MLGQAKQPAIGLYYVSAVCKSCQKIIPLDDDPEPGMESFYCRGPTMVRCPFCESADLYHPRELTTQLLRELPPIKL
jgi:hypothetical protein